MAEHNSESAGDFIPGGTFGMAPPLFTGALTPLILRQRLHDLSNAMTGLIGNLELVDMSTEDPVLDLESLNTALEAARNVVAQVRLLKNEVELQISGEATS
jgi:hypothetical protein